MIKFQISLAILLDQLTPILKRNWSSALLILKDPFLSNKVSDYRRSSATHDSRNVSIELTDRGSRERLPSKFSTHCGSLGATEYFSVLYSNHESTETLLSWELPFAVPLRNGRQEYAYVIGS